MVMPRAVAVDDDGFYLYDLPENPKYTGQTGTAPAWDTPPGLISPRWNGAAWVEGEEPAEVERQTIARVAADHRAWRNAELARADVKVNDAIDRGNAAALDAWTRYRIALRDMPQQSADPRQWTRPEAPQA